MKHTQLSPNINREAFARWGNGMMILSNSFDLSMPFNGTCSPSNVTYEAEQAACAIGYAPWFEVGTPEIYELEDSVTGLRSFEAGGWNQYALDIMDNDLSLGNWIGSQFWGATWEQVVSSGAKLPPMKINSIGVDNTAKGSGQRILYALEHGVPDWKSIVQMWEGERDLPYTGIGSIQEELIDIKKWFNVTEMSQKTNLELV